MMRSAITLDASMTVEAALAALAGLPPSADVVVRRREGIEVYWYAMRVGHIRRLPEDLGPGVMSRPLKVGLDLHEGQRSATYQLEQMTKAVAEGALGVLLDGEDVVGVVEPRPQMAAYSRGPTIGYSMGPTANGGPRAPRPAPPPDIQASVMEAPPSARAARTRTINPYPRLDAPANVAPRQEFHLVIGLSREQLPGVAGGPLTIATAEEEFDLGLLVKVPEGFGAPDGVRHTLHVRTSRYEEAETRVRLAASEARELLQEALEVEFSYRGSLLGRAWREIRVVPLDVAAPTAEVRGGSTPIVTAAPENEPDLTVTISESADGSMLVWGFHTSHPVTKPQGQVQSKFKQQNAQTFALQEIRTMAEADGSLLLDQKVMGVARDVADLMINEAPDDSPKEPGFWEVLGGVWADMRITDAKAVPSLLIVSEEPYIPWELASTEEDYLDPALVDPSRPPLLGAQVRVGRWITGKKTPRGPARPPYPPEVRVGIEKMALVVGDYLATGPNPQRPLLKAKEEGQALKKKYPSVWLTATEHDLDQLLEGRLEEDGDPVAVQAIHFACHGEVSDNLRYNGIVLSNTTQRLSPTILRGADTTAFRNSAPFVFLNACQLALASKTVADDQGMPGAFLKEGSRGLVAPLWSVNDQLAHDVAVEFYEKAVDKQIEVSEVMRGIRSRFDVNAETPASTFLAYVFFGHPKLVLNKVQS